MLRKPKTGIRKDKSTEKGYWAMAGAAHIGSGGIKAGSNKIFPVKSKGDETPQAVTEDS